MNEDEQSSHLDVQGQDIPQPDASTSIETTEPEYSSQLEKLAAEHRDLQSKYQQALERRTKQRDEFKARYQAAATKLNKYKLSDGGFPPLDDSYLIGKVEVLQDMIWKFSLHHYEEQAVSTAREQSARANQLLVDDIRHNIRRNITIQGALESTNWRPLVIQSFIWRFLVFRVFNRFFWAGRYGQYMGIVYASMRNNLVNPTATDLQSFQTWSATTTKLIRESQKRGALGWVENREERLDNAAREIWQAIIQHHSSESGGLKKDIHDILKAAIELDEEISQQLANFRWEFATPGEIFDEKRMKLAESEQLHSNKEINIIICPGMTKRGQAGNFDKVDWLVPVKVSCSTPIPPRPARLRDQLHDRYHRITKDFL